MIDQTIACLERLSQSVDPTVAPAAPRRRGRKFMGPEDRMKVSQRMKEYWAARREEKAEVQAEPKARPATLAAGG